MGVACATARAEGSRRHVRRKAALPRCHAGVTASPLACPGMRRYDQRVYILRVWIERDRFSGRPSWRASLTDELEGRTQRYFSSLASLLEHLRDRLQAWRE